MIAFSVFINLYTSVIIGLEQIDDVEYACDILPEYVFILNYHLGFQFAVGFIMPIILVCFFNIFNIKVLLGTNKRMSNAGDQESSMMSDQQYFPNLLKLYTPSTPQNNTTEATSFQAIEKIEMSNRRHSTIQSIIPNRHVNIASINRKSNKATNVLVLLSACFVGFNLPFVVAWVKIKTLFNKVSFLHFCHL